MSSTEIIAFRALKFSDKGKELYNLPFGLDGDADDPRVNALSAAGYSKPHPHVADWPTDGRAHPERTIRNAVFGYNAARAYQVDATAKVKAIKCDQVNQLHDDYIVDSGKATARAPLRAGRASTDSPSGCRSRSGTTSAGTTRRRRKVRCVTRRAPIRARWRSRCRSWRRATSCRCFRR